MVRAWWGVTAFQVSVQYWLLPDIGPALPLFSVILAAFWLPWGWTVHRFLAAPLTGRRVAAALLVVPSAWICAEAVRSWQSLGGPWALLGATQWNQPTMLASASLGGVWFTGFLIVVANTALVVVLLEARARTRAVAAVTLAACTAVGPAWSAVRPGLPLVGTAEVAIVQPGTGASAYDQQAFETSATAALAGRPLDLVVWGESSVADDLTGDPDLTGSLPALVRSLGADLLVNGRASASGPSGSYNESVLIGPAGTLGDYAKMRLVPFGEYIPFRAALGWLTSISKATSSNLIRGGAVTVVHAGPLAVGPLLCFESAFPDMARTEVSRGAQLLVYQNNTSTFQKSWAQPQHAALAAVRAAEAGRPVVHASLTGVSAVFDAHGRKLAWRPATFRGAFITRIPLVSGTTPYERTGDWTLVLAVLILGAAVTHDALRSFRG
jgi:apolipoprotein N-acyltransferase